MRNTRTFSLVALFIFLSVSCSKEISIEQKPFLIKEWKLQSISYPRLINDEPDTIILLQPSSARLEFTETGNWVENSVPFPDELPNPLPPPTSNGVRIELPSLETDLKVISGYYKIPKKETIVRFLPTGSDTLVISNTTDTSILFTRTITKVIDANNSKRETYLIYCIKQ